jgi:sugar phosphate isomerase/epimerase
MQLGIFAKTFDGTSAAAVLPQVKAAGFGVAQYNLACSGLASMPDDVATNTAVDIAKAARQSGVRLNALSATYNMIHPDMAQREKGHRRLALVAQVARDAGIPLLTLCTGTRHPTDQWAPHPDNNTPQSWADLCKAMETAIALADQHDLALGIEPELANVVNSAARARQLLGDMQSPRIRIVLDPANLFETETGEHQRRIVSEAVDMLADRIIMAHAKDRSTNGAFVAAGTGILDYDHFIRTLSTSGFDGPLVTHGLSATEAPAVAQFLKRACTAAGVVVQS